MHTTAFTLRGRLTTGGYGDPRIAKTNGCRSFLGIYIYIYIYVIRIPIFCVFLFVQQYNSSVAIVMCTRCQYALSYASGVVAPKARHANTIVSPLMIPTMCVVLSEHPLVGREDTNDQPPSPPAFCGNCALRVQLVDGVTAHHHCAPALRGCGFFNGQYLQYDMDLS